MISKAQLGYFYEARRKMDEAVGQLFGNDIHLHDLSSDRDSNQISNSFGHKNNNVISSKQSIQPSPKNNIQINTIRKTNDKLNDFYANVNNQTKMEKMYKQNIQLQKKIMALKDQNQLYKHKALLWEKIKQYILDNIHNQYKLKSIRFNTSDSAIVEQFLTILDDILKRSKQVNKSGGQNVDHSVCRQLLEDSKKKIQEQTKKVSKLTVEIEILTKQNIILKDKQNNAKKQRKSRIDQIQEGMNQKFVLIQNSLIQKTKQNKQLHNKIGSLQSEIYQLRNASSPLRRKQRTITTQADTIRADNSEIDLLRKISKIKDEEINTLKQQGKLLSGQIGNLKNTNEKMKKVIRMAQTMNNQFIQKIEDSMRRSQTKGLNELAISQYDPDRVLKNIQIEKDFHLVNRRFKIVKSRSLDKQTFSYGQKGRN